MTKVSSGKPKRGPPAYANSYAFHHNPASKLTAHIMSLPINDLCPSCVAVIEWRKRYRKYKPLTVLKKCTACGQKRIKEAYHVVCAQCCRIGDGQCAKCLLPPSQWKSSSKELEELQRDSGSGSVSGSAVKIEKASVETVKSKKEEDSEEEDVESEDGEEDSEEDSEDYDSEDFDESE